MSTATGRFLPRPAGIALALAALIMAGCDRLSGTLELTGNVGAIAPQPIGEERLRVATPATGARATLAPVAENGDVTVWQTLDGITLSLQGGVLVATRGLGDDLMSADVEGDVAILLGTGDMGYYPHIRSYLDGEDQTVFRSYQCRRAGQTRTTLRIDGTARPTRRIEVQCTSPRHDFTNVFWSDNRGKLLKSRQWISPTMQYMETERVLR
jgi:hypothetical protein